MNWWNKPVNLFTRLSDVTGPLTDDEEEVVNTEPIHNKSKRKKTVGKMLNSTAYILREFYRKFNSDLAELLGDSRFTWEDTYATW